MKVVTSIEEMRAWRRSSLDPVVTVFTMGALHSGHSELIRAARAYLDAQHEGRGYVVVSIFVNPTQFESAADLQNYPKNTVADHIVCEAAGVDVVFSPTATDMYPQGMANLIEVYPNAVARILEGQSRPGHFVGMLTIVNKLLHIIEPAATFFGEKDYQQLTLVRGMVRDLNMEVDVVGVPTMRDLDGVALSSRNARLDRQSRLLAAQLPAAMAVVRHSLSEGHGIYEAARMGRAYLNAQAGIDLDYLEILSNDLEPVTTRGLARIFVAATIGGVRLIDNSEVEI